MKNNYKLIYLSIIYIAFTSIGCKTPILEQRFENRDVPMSFNATTDTSNTAKVKWKDFFDDPYLDSLINGALANNQELNIMMREIEIHRNEISVREGEYLPFVNLGGGIGSEKVGRYTSQGANDANTEIKPGKEFPDPLQDFNVGAYATWEIDIWDKLHNAKRSAVKNYLASIEGRNFMITNLIAEIADSYYELLAYDNQLAIINTNIEIQQNALDIVKLQKESAKVTELAVKRFEAQLYNSQSLQYTIMQNIIEAENKINFIVGRFPQPVARSRRALLETTPKFVNVGIPAQMLDNRPDIRQAELELEAAKLDIQVAKANFYPSLGLNAGLGFQSFNPKYLLKTPESLLFSLAGDMVGPLINKRAIKAEYYNANAKQIQAIINYERTILTAYIEVSNQLSKIDNMANTFALKAKQVDVLNQAVSISNDLFRSTRADYMEVLMTQRDALESEFDLIETKVAQMNAMVNIYQALGGGWN